MRLIVNETPYKLYNNIPMPGLTSPQTAARCEIDPSLGLQDRLHCLFLQKVYFPGQTFRIEEAGNEGLRVQREIPEEDFDSLIRSL